jgi:hypothetical protein
LLFSRAGTGIVDIDHQIQSLSALHGLLGAIPGFNYYRNYRIGVEQLSGSIVTEALTKVVTMEGYTLGGHFHREHLMEIAESQRQRALDAGIESGFLESHGGGWYNIEYQTMRNIGAGLAEIFLHSRSNDVGLTDEDFDQCLIAALVDVVEAAAIEIGAMSKFELCSFYELVPDWHWNEVREVLREDARFYMTGKTKGTAYHSIFAPIAHIAGGEEA